MFLNLLKDALIKKVGNAVVAGTTTQTLTAWAMDGYDSCCVILDLGAVTDAAVITLKLQDGAASDGSDAADITGATCTFTASTSSNTMMIVDVHRPLKRYLRAVITRTTQNVVIDTVIAILYNSHSRPVTLDATVLASASQVAAT